MQYLLKLPIILNIAFSKINSYISYELNINKHFFSTIHLIK